MNSKLAEIYGTGGMYKTASEEEEITLDDVSAADFLAAVESGEIDLDDYFETETEKVAEDDFDLSEVPDEELLAALQELGEEEEDGAIEKMASSGDLEYWDTAGRIMAHAYTQENEKIASGDMDLNELSVEEFVDFAASLEGEMEKEAAGVRESATALKAWLARQGKEAGRRLRHPKDVYSAAQKRMKDKAGRLSGEGRSARGARAAIAGAESGAPYAIGGAAAGAGGYGAYALGKKRRRKGRR